VVPQGTVGGLRLTLSYARRWLRAAGRGGSLGHRAQSPASGFRPAVPPPTPTGGPILFPPGAPPHPPNAFHSSGGVWSPCFGCWGRQQAPAGHPSTARAGPGPAGAQPAKRKTDPGPCLRATPVMMSGAGCPIWQRRFWSWHGRTRIATYNLLPKVLL
jgi:hypothetical protein